MSGQVVSNEETLTLSAEHTHAVEWIGNFKTRWEMQRLLGRGGQSEVWLAHDTQLREPVAVKVFAPRLSADDMTRLRREVRIGRSLRHPGLVRIYELIESTHGLALVMEWLPGGSLAQRLEAGPLPIEMVTRAARDTLAALAFLHRNDIVHRDIKPSNLLLDAEEQVHVADLGLLKSVGEDRDQTETYGTVGTPLYMSPEQIRSQPLSPATDLYALGATLYHLITGEPPFTGESTYAIAQQHLKQTAVDPRCRRSDCPRWLARFVMRLLEKSPGDRWSDAGVAAEVFQRRRLSVSPRWWRRLGAVLAVGILLVVGTTALIRGWTAALSGSSVFVAEDRIVRGLDDSGVERWRFSCPHPVQQLMEIDLDGDERNEVLASAYPRGSSVRGKSDYQSEIVALDRRGRLITRFSPEGKVQVSREQPRPPMFFTPILVALDLDGDGLTEVVANCRHRGLATTYLFVFWPGHDRWEPLLEHEGWIFDIRTVPGYTDPHLRFLAFANTLAALPAVAELQLTAPPVEGNRPADVWRHPAAVAGANPVLWADFAWYTPLPQAPPGSFDAIPPFTVDDSGASVVSMAGRQWTIERWGNPVPGPNAGRDLSSLRVRFLQRLRILGSYRALVNPISTRAAISEMEREYAPLLAEEPYRAVLAEAASSALARVGDLAGGIEILQQAWRDISYDSLGCGLANLQAMAGDLSSAVATLERTIERGQTPAGDFRAVNLLTRVAIEMHDQDLFAAASGSLAVDAGYAKPVVVARANLWWDQLEAADCRLESLDVTPDAEAVACLARWRRGQVTEQDLEDMEDALVRNPDAEDDLRLAQAAVLLALAREEEALAALEELLRLLERRAKADFMTMQTATLACAIEITTLVRLGRRAEASTRAETLAAKLRPDLLPAILVSEALGSQARIASAGGGD